MMLRKLNTKILSTLIIGLMLVMARCRVSKGVSAIMAKEVKQKEYTYKDKSIVFIPLVHFGQKEFYSSLKSIIESRKKEGYTVFYEQVKSGASVLGIDSTTNELYMRKFRRINGGNATAEDYAKEVQEVFKNGIPQPKYTDLGIDSTDLNVDVSLLDVINQFEAIYQPIELDSCDNATPLDSAYTCAEGLKTKVVDPIYVDFRNKNVVETVINSKEDSIVILYGAAHWKGIKKLLKQSN